MPDARVGLALHAPAAGELAAGALYGDAGALRRLIREAVSAATGDSANVASRSAFAGIVAPGASVLLKPNWVLHYNEAGAGMECMITSPAFVLAVLAEVIAAGAGRVVIGDAPIQGAEFDGLATVEFRAQARTIAGSVPLDIVDFRKVVATRERGRLRHHASARAESRYVEFDLAGESRLEPVSSPPDRFRCTNYDPDQMAGVQRPGVHRFLLAREPFEVDVILNLPKLKTHAKGGITAALKNLVGMNGDKNYLPHHRVGGSSLGGDCYQGLKPFKRIGEALLDAANRRIGRPGYLAVLRAGQVANLVHGGDLEGKWWGNDTTWRMVLDLNRILLYGDADGGMHESPQRRIWTLTDALVAGERNGPLAPEPRQLRAVTCASNAAHADVAHLALMRFDPMRVPLVREAFAATRYPIAAGSPADTRVWLGGEQLDADQVAERCGQDFRPPDGWVGRVESRHHRSVQGASLRAG